MVNSKSRNILLTIFIVGFAILGGLLILTTRAETPEPIVSTTPTPVPTYVLEDVTSPGLTGDGKVCANDMTLFNDAIKKGNQEAFKALAEPKDTYTPLDIAIFIAQFRADMFGTETQSPVCK